MPITYVGRTISHRGKPLYEILTRLKNFGVGRIVYRNTFMSRYDEPSFFVVTKVHPEMNEPLDSIVHRVTAHQYFRGEYQGEFKMRTCYKADWRLVPREEEQKYLTYKPEKERPRNIIPDSLPFPPLLERLELTEMEAQGKDTSVTPRLPITIRKDPTNRALQQSEARFLGYES